MAKEIPVEKREIIFLLALMLGVLALRIPLLFMPMDGGEGAAAYIAECTYQGNIPYKDTYDNSQPFIYYIYRAAFDAFGVSTTAIRGFTMIYVIFTLLLVYILARVLAGGFAAMLAALFYAMYQHNHLLQGFTSSPELFAQFPMLLGLLFLLDREKGYEPAGFFLAGFFMAVAFYTGLFTAPVMLVPVIFILFSPEMKKQRLKCFFWYLAGLVIVDLLVLAWAVKNNILQVYIKDAFIDYWSGAAAAPAGFFKDMPGLLPAIVLPAAAVVYSVIKIVSDRKDWKNFILFLIVIAVAAGTTRTGNFMLFVPFLSVLAAFMVKDLAVFTRKKAGVAASAAVIVVLLASNAFLFESATRTLNFVKSGGYAGGMAHEAQAISNYIKNSKEPADRLLVAANEPGIYFLAGMKAPFRGLHLYPENALSAKVFQDLPEFLVTEKNRPGIFSGIIKEKYNIIMEGNSLNLYGLKMEGNHEAGQ